MQNNTHAKSIVRRHALRQRGTQAAMGMIAMGPFALMNSVTLAWTLLSLPLLVFTGSLARQLLAGSNSLLKRLDKEHRRADAADPLAARVNAMAERMNITAPVTYHSYNYTYAVPSLVPRVKPAIVLQSLLFNEKEKIIHPFFTEEEQDAVIAHELVHIKNRNHIGNGLAKLFMFCALASALGAPNNMATASAAFAAVVLLYFSYNRHMESRTDAEAALLNGNPAALASALQELEGSDFVPEKNLIRHLFSTHPSPATRQQDLRRLAQAMNVPMNAPQP